MYMPLVRALAGTWPAPEAGDPHLALLRRLPVLWCRIMALFEARGELWPAMFGFVVLGRIALASSGVVLGAAIARSGPARYAPALGLVLARPWAFTFAHFALLHAEALPAAVASPLAIAACVAAARRRPDLAGALLGLAFDLHPVQATGSIVPVGVALSLAAGSTMRRALVRASVPFAVLAGPLALWILLHRPPPLPVAEVRAIAHTVVVTHLFASAFGREDWGGALGLAGAACALLPLVSARRPLRCLGFAGLAGLVVATCGLALADANLLPAIGYPLHLGRNAVVTKGLVLGFASSAVFRSGERRGLRLGRALVLGGLLEAPALAAVGVAALGVRAIMYPAPRGSLARWISPLALPLGIASYAAAPGSPLEWPRGLVVSGALLALTSLPRRGGSLEWGRALAVVLVTVAVHHAGLVWNATEHAIVVRWGRIEAHAPPASEPRAALAHFLETETPVDARLMLPPEDRYLLYAGGRSVVAAANWGTLGIWDPAYGQAEVERLRTIGFVFGSDDPKAQERAYHAWPPAKVLDAARRVGATHVVVDRALGDPDLGTPVYDDRARYKVYAVPGPR